MVTRDQVLTKSTDQGATSLAVKILTRVDPGIMASAGRRYLLSDGGELQVTERSPSSDGEIHARIQTIRM